MKTISLNGNFQQGWYFAYLAWLAAYAGNWVTQGLERPGVSRAIKMWPDSEKPPGSYPTDGVSAWWVILCLDGAPERVQHLLYAAHHLVPVALTFCEWDEKRFLGLISTTIDFHGFHPRVFVKGNWRDGVIYGFESRQAAIEFVEAVGFRCECENRYHDLPWTQQFHARAGISEAIGDAFAMLLNAKRGQACIHHEGTTAREWSYVQIGS